MKYIFSLFLLFALTCNIVIAESYLYVEATKDINGGYKYYLPKLELNKCKWAGEFFGQEVWYLSEFVGGLLYTAPRSSATSVNHHSVEAAWHLGLTSGPFWITTSLGGRWYLDGNSSGIPEGVEGSNSIRCGLLWQ